MNSAAGLYIKAERKANQEAPTKSSLFSLCLLQRLFREDQTWVLVYLGYSSASLAKLSHRQLSYLQAGPGTRPFLWTITSAAFTGYLNSGGYMPLLKREKQSLPTFTFSSYPGVSRTICLHLHTYRGC